jgi:hypothetical protein
MGTWNRKTVSGTDFSDRMGVDRTVPGIGSRHALCGAQPLATAALGVSQALSFFDPAIINLPSLENCERIVALAQSGLEL